jgi:RNA polymerase subunit RPABC4/transcription elongation factor Spt4
MIEHEGDYCPDCNALWPKGQETCQGCGHIPTDSQR